MNNEEQIQNLKYYNANAQNFLERASKTDMSFSYKEFEKHLSSGNHILDAGCGPGVHAAYFLSRGYKVSGFDSSSKFVKMSREIKGFNVEENTFQEICYDEIFDGIWACASLLHIPDSEIDNVLTRLFAALKSGGVCCLSVKVGDGWTEENGRYFNHYTQERLNEVVCRQSVEIVKVWQDEAKNYRLIQRQWISMIVRKF